METFIKEFEHLQIPLEEIKSATDNFDHTKVIGHGGFGKVYEGELSHFKGRDMVAIKRLDRTHGQGDSEFWKEITILNRHRHENLITLLGFCIECGEMILVYEHASKGSLDGHLSSTSFTWTQRLKACVGAARGLSFLHDAKGTKERIIHRDIKSANILLDANWNAKVSDMGLSKIAPANQKYTGLVTQVAGTRGYCDPLYIQTGYLTKESDVYSFGVLLFELLCGRFCFIYENNQSEVPMWELCYEQNKLHEIIFDDLKKQIDKMSLKAYSDIAFKCLLKSREKRPTMSHVVKELETALTYQELYERTKLPKDYKKMLLTAADPLNEKSESELKMLLLKGILINSGKTWFSRNMNGDHCEMISIESCLTSTASDTQNYISSPEYIKRFSVGCYEPSGAKFKTYVRTQFLTPQIMYTVNLVFKRKSSKERYIGLEYKLEGDEGKSYSFVSDEREDGWLTAELYQFTSDQSTVDLKILFYTKWCPNLLIESIEFRPLENVEHEVLTVDKVDIQPFLATDTYWEQKLPIDYKDIIKLTKHGVQWRTMKELYNILCEGLLINDGKEWFSLAKDRKKCLMLPAKAILEGNKWEWISEPESRFGQVADCISKKIGILCKFSSEMLSPQTTYTAYLIYKLPHFYKDINPPVQVVNRNSNSEEEYNIFLRTPQTPVIRGNIKMKRTYNPSFRPMIKGLPKLRNDGWMEVQVHEFQTRASIKMISMRLRLSSYDMSLAGTTLQGLEFRPI